jgi:adhesin/invasin
LSEFVGGLPAAEQQTVANPFNKGYQGADEFGTMAVGLLNSAATQKIKDWFTARNATTEMAFNVGSKGSKSASFDMLFPLFDTEKDLVFTQVGVRRSNAHTEDYRITVNGGVGYRRNIDNWIAGINSFYDRDLTGKNHRLGIGAEAFTDNIRFSGNAYIRLSEWKKSPDLDYYLERPANGYDLRVEGNLPAYPKLIASAKYEKYFGNDVALFGSGNRQKDPQAVSVGLTYSPVPMISTGIDYRQGQGGLSETSVKLAVNYQFGVPLNKQLSTAYTTNHNLANSRYSLVNRNNEIVLDYKKAENAQLMLPPEISGTPSANVLFPIKLTGGHVTNVMWTGTASSFARPYNSSGTGSVVLPAFNPTGLNAYSLQAVGTDVYGGVVKSNVMQVTVTPFLIALERSKAEAKADGTDEVTFTASLLEPTGEPRANTAIVWSISGSATVVSKDAVTNQQGKANLKLTSRSSSSVRVSAKEPQGAAATADADFLGDPTSAKIVGLVATPAVILANGTATSTLVATVIDKNGNSLGAGIPVTWKTTNGTLASESTVTDEESKATIVLTSPVQIGDATVTAKAVAGSADAKVDFVADIANARVMSLVAAPGVIPADGTSSSVLTATIGDANGNPVGAGVPVSWATTDGTLSTPTGVTDAASKATVTLKSSTKMGTATVTVKAAAGEATAPVAFAANNATAKVAALVALPTSIPANNITTSSLEATIEDANGNPVAGAPVAWHTSLGTLSNSTTTTDTNGKSVVTLKGAVAGTATVNAQAVAGSLTASVDLVPDNTTAKVVELNATPTTIPANNVATSTIEAVVKDANGNPVPSVAVTWSTSLGDLSDASTTTDAGGRTSITLKGPLAGSATVKATATAGSSTAVVTLTPDAATAKVIGLVATPTTIVANGTASSTLVASVEDANGNPVVGTTVTWGTNLGTLSSASSNTDAAGKATVTLKGTVAGSASITATAVAGGTTTNVTLTADGTTAKVIDLTATPTSITANGSSTSTLVATISDANGNPVGSGAVVRWSTTSGYLAATSTVTDSDSKASVVLTSSTIAGTATVTAASAAGTANAQVTFTPDASAARVINLTATPSTITANGSDQSIIIATVEDAYGNKMSPGVTVSWNTSEGSLSSSTTVTDAAGKARVTLTSGTAMGLANVTGTAAAGSSSTSVQFVADVASARVIALSGSPTTIRANGSDISTFVATVEDSGGNPMPAGVTVSWSTTRGNLASGSTVTDGRGKATVTLTGTVAGAATVTASAAKGSASAGATLIADVSTSRVIGVTASPTSIVANGSATSTLTATVTDAHGNVIPAGVSVSWSTNLGSVSSGTTVTDAAGKTSVTLRGTAAGTATVQAAAIAGASSVNVALTADAATARVVGVTATPNVILANNAATSTLVATVRDANGNTMGAGVTVNWSTSSGTLSSGSSATNASGQASVTLRGGIAGSATITAAAVQGSASTSVTLVADASTARVISLVANPASVPANGTNTTLYATVRDAYGNALPAGQAVQWATSLGNLNTGVSYTDGNGIAVAYIGSTVAGGATVYAKTTVSANATTGVNFTATNPVISSFTEVSNYTPARANFLDFDGSGWLLSSATFSWNVIGATSYEVIGPRGAIYSGSASSFTWPAGTRVPPPGATAYDETWTLRAWNGAAYSDVSIVIRAQYITDPSYPSG